MKRRSVLIRPAGLLMVPLLLIFAAPRPLPVAAAEDRADQGDLEQLRQRLEGKPERTRDSRLAIFRRRRDDPQVSEAYVRALELEAFQRQDETRRKQHRQHQRAQANRRADQQ